MKKNIRLKKPRVNIQNIINYKMKKIVIGLAVVIIILVAILMFVPGKSGVVEKANPDFSSSDGTYTVEGQKVTLKNGLSEVSIAPDSASKIVTRYFGNEVKYDFDGDGREDSAFLITQDAGGSGTFFYAVARLNKIDGPVGSEAFLLGDRIAPQTTELREGGVILVNYADRNPGESFAVQPSAGKSVWLVFDTETIKLEKIPGL